MGIMAQGARWLRTPLSRLRMASAFAMGILAQEHSQLRRRSAKDISVPPQDGQSIRNGDPGSRTRMARAFAMGILAQETCRLRIFLSRLRMARVFATGILAQETCRLRTFLSRLRMARVFAMGILAQEHSQLRLRSAKDIAVPRAPEPIALHL